MKRRLSYITVEEAFNRIGDATSLDSLDSDTISIHEACGRVLAQNMISGANIPPRDMSHFDGFAIKAADTKDASVENPAYFEVIGKIYPGQRPKNEVHHGEAYYITTGALLPKGADSVIRVEATKRVSENRIEVRTRIDLYEHVVRRGSDIEKGQPILSRGHRLRAQDLTMLATLGVETVEVVKRPRVAIICVGDELTDQPRETRPGKIFNSLRHMTSTMIQECGGMPVYLGIVPDNVVKIQERLKEGLSRADMLLLVGGTSMGKKDVTPEAINSVGEPGVIVHGIKRKPGRVSGFAVVRDKPVVLLPGLCQSTVIGFYTFAFPLILVIGGLSLTDSQLTLKAKITKPISFETFIPFEHVTFVNVKRTKQGYLADPLFGESNSIGALVNANAFIITPPKKATVNAGEEVEVNLLPGFFSLKDILTTKC
ncbi:hypothetical protein GWN63_06525 [Candidatus Bathyarchaeota archaeon]|nr:molybdopterin molybdotransferase MoeA [Candidatus Bathyarchaeota archaeon]NIU81873.1 hypothetical protein [Candidatus Bathyarchaeota archaeon]NIV68506.1 hypothetical protein [Candidatus Bathyarchaeota archaeon]NIW16801.1 hypothetical protein [Candidatus Bathyarchaeota archaeon]NIW34790.1 hypothetical protein [Candidatus Bathyarchaeota archaeon]